MLIVCALPTTLIDGACWGQCDTVYVFLIVMSLYWMKTERARRRGGGHASLAFAFELQTIFFFPVVLLALIHGEYKPNALVFAATYLLTMLRR